MTGQFVATNGIAGLFEPLEVNGMRLSNRFIMPGMQRSWSSKGAPVQRMTDYYCRRISGGVAMIISESCAVTHPSATAQPLACRMDTTTADAWKRTIGSVRDIGGNFLVQLWHEGALRADADKRTISASGIAYPGFRRGRVASVRDLEEVIEAFAKSARIAQSAGANGIELHCAHGFFLDQFLWSETNARDDEYGGSRLVDRATLHAQILRAVRNVCGPDFVLSVRFSQWKEHDYSAKIAHSPDELQEFFQLLVEAGADMFHASARRFWEPEWDNDPRSIAGWTKALSGKPTAAVGSVGLDRDVMQSFSDEGDAKSSIGETIQRMREGLTARQFDMLAVGRSLIGDPDLIRKIEAGEIDAIRPFRKSDISDFSWDA